MTADELRLSIGSTLSNILSLSRDLQAEAEARFADKEFPGGDAMVMLGPVANVEAFNYRQLSEMMGRTDGGSGADELDTDPAPPLLVLAGWVDIVKAERGETSLERATIPREVGYLRSAVDWICGSNAEGEPYFLAADELDNSLRSLQYQLEAVLKDGTRITHGAPCLHCTGVNLVRVEDARLGLQDSYYCPSCRRDYKKSNYDYVVGVTHLHNAHELTAEQIEQRTGIRATRVRVWGSRYEGLKTKRSPEGPWLYDVAAVIAKRDEIEALWEPVVA